MFDGFGSFGMGYWHLGALFLPSESEVITELNIEVLER